MARPDPLAALGIHVKAGGGELGRLLFDARSEVNELVLASLDPAARWATRDAAVFWPYLSYQRRTGDDARRRGFTPC